MSATSTPMSIGTPSARAARENSAGLWVSAAIGVVAVVAAVGYLVLALHWRGQPFPGVLLTHTLTVDGSIPVAADTWPGFQAGLQRGDHIVGLNDRSFPADVDAAEAEYDAVMQTLRPGDSVTVQFERPAINIPADDHPAFCGDDGSGVAACQVALTLTSFPIADFVADFCIPFFAGIISLSIGVTVLALRPRSLPAQMVGAVCFTLSLFMLGLFDINTTRQFTPLWIIGTTFSGAAFACTAFIYPTRLAVTYRRPGIQYVPVALGALAAGAIIVLYSAPASPQQAVWPTWLAVLAGLVGMVFLSGVLVRRREAAASLAIRDQSNTALIGMLLALVIGIVWALNLGARLVLGYEPLPLNTSAATPFLILPPLSMAYALLQYRSLDTDRVISQALTYSLLLLALVIGYFLLVLSAALVAGQVIGANNPILMALVIFGVVALFVPVRSRLQDRIDAVYYRKRRTYQNRLESFGQRLSALIDFDDILSAYRAEVEATLMPQQMFIFLPDRQTGEFTAAGTDIRFDPASPLVEGLRSGDGLIYLEPGQPWPRAAIAERSRLLILKTSLVAGLRGANRLSGIVCIAPPQNASGRYTYEELRYLQSLTAQISVAVERAQVVDSLEHRVRELDVLSQVSQAVNFSIDVNDLLELIYAQTVRLIDATHFYITLRDPATDELYHAFFLEDGERYTERENLRWSLGSDLFSEVVRSGQPVAVTDYGAALDSRGVQPIYEDKNVRAWIGVPMLAGSRVIGVLAGGTTEAGRSYTDDERRIFTDIGALAATSLDKARLFAETNARARQLSALNNISQQIVAAEADVEKLLQLIMASATDILGAAAGSLLLTVDDGSGDLQFRVAVGGSGEELIGSRLPAGRGLVGEVAAKGKPVIVNDATSDPRWGGELSKGAFHTTSILAVPLVTQNSVIGVLEVLNKRSGAAFTRDDVALLTTFAGQAAVAIENARLFQMTDLQLSQRLTELETLEHIDVELNRSLDLTKVAQISLRWAMENSRATAGLIGLVVGDPPHLEVITRVGYEDADLPASSEDGVWPLDRGIVSRVLRTKQADLVPDVRIDPNYVPSLRGALSQITLPMLSGGSVNAILLLETNREPRLRLADMPFLQRLAEHASIAIVNAQLYAELTRANQSKSEFVSFVAHELKNPLTSIKGYSDVLLGVAGVGLSDQQKNFLSTIRFNAERMNTLVSDLNDVTKLQTDNLRMEFAPVDFAKALAETLRPLQKQIDDKRQTLEFDLDDDLPMIRADLNRLIQVLTNLLSNAHKYTPPDGSIQVGAHVDRDARNNKGRLLAPRLHVSVTDTGIGMSPDDLNRLFTPYFRSDNPLTREQPGTGLGLTITRGIIERHGGSIWVESELGTGTTFHFSILLANEKEAKQAGD